MQLEPARADRRQADEAADDIERNHDQDQHARRQRHPDRQKLGEPLDDFRFDQKHDRRQHQGAERKGERAEGDEHADFARCQPLRSVGPVAHDGAGKDGGAEIVRERIGGERADGDEPQRDTVAEVIERQLVVAGKRCIGDQRRADRQQPALQ
ncbi:hypothetical protein D3C86_1717680 [compost metagenome]